MINGQNTYIKQRQLLSIASMNCRGLADHTKRRDVLHFLKSKKHSIYCLQDVHWDKNIESRVRAEWGLECFFSSFKSNARGVAILFNNNFEFNVHRSCNDPNGNFLALHIEVSDMNITLINIYGPNKDEPFFYDGISDTINNFDNPHTVICGDWNLVLNDNIDCINYVNINNPLAKKRVLSLCGEHDLTDPWRIQHPTTASYTWRRHDSVKQS